MKASRDTVQREKEGLAQRHCLKMLIVRQEERIRHTDAQLKLLEVITATSSGAVDWKTLNNINVSSMQMFLMVNVHQHMQKAFQPESLWMQHLKSIKFFVWALSASEKMKEEVICKKPFLRQFVPVIGSIWTNRTFSRFTSDRHSCENSLWQSEDSGRI